MNNVSIEKEIKRLIEENFTKPDFDVNHLANKLGIDRFTLYKKTLKYYNCNPRHLIEAKRLTKALEMLSKDEKVTCVCYNSGYASPKSFRRAFKNSFEITPSKFKNEYLYNKLINYYLSKIII